MPHSVFLFSFSLPPKKNSEGSVTDSMYIISNDVVIVRCIPPALCLCRPHLCGWMHTTLAEAQFYSPADLCCSLSLMFCWLMASSGPGNICAVCGHRRVFSMVSPIGHPPPLMSQTNQLRLEKWLAHLYKA